MQYDFKLKVRARELRNNSTLAEVLLWNEIKGKKIYGYRFTRQRPIGNYIVDFCCDKLKLIIEIDGVSHDGNVSSDIKRQEELEKKGYTLIRFADCEIKKKMDGVVKTLKMKIEEISTNNPHKVDAPLTKGD